MSSPPNPPTTATATATATADFLKSVARQRPRKHLHPAIYQTFYNPTTAPFPPPTHTHTLRPQHLLHSNSRTHHQQQGVLYPVASSGRGFLSKHQQSNSDQNASVDAFPTRPVSAYPYAVHRPYAFSNSDISGQTSHQLVAQSSGPMQPTLMGGGGVTPTFATGVSIPANPKGVGSGRGAAKRLFIDLNERPQEEETVHPNDQPNGSAPVSLHSYVHPGFQNTDMAVVKQKDMVVGQSSVSDDNGLKHTRDKNGDDTFVIIRDRKVQVSEGTSLYAQCRSWLKNGFTLENQPQYADYVKSLPKPLPASVVESRKEDDMETEEETKDAEHLSAKELLQQHVKHAKKVRARLRNQRLQRIERYKDRLALLLPPVVDQQTKNDPAS